MASRRTAKAIFSSDLGLTQTSDQIPTKAATSSVYASFSGCSFGLLNRPREVAVGIVIWDVTQNRPAQSADLYLEAVGGLDLAIHCRRSNINIQSPTTVPPRPTNWRGIDCVARRLCLEPLCNGLPVDHIPDGAKVLGLAVLILQVVGVLPSVNAQQRDQVASNRVLVRTSHQRQSASLLVLGQPRPSATLDTGEGSVGLFLESREGTEIAVDSFLLWQGPSANLSIKLVTRLRSFQSGRIGVLGAFIPSARQLAHHHRPCSLVPSSPRTVCD